MVIGQALVNRRRDDPQVLAHHHGAGQGGLQAGDRQHLVQRVAHIGAVGGRVAVGHPPLPGQAHHMVEAQQCGEAQVMADGLAEVAVAGGPRARRVDRRETPVLAAHEHRVGRSTDGHAGHEQVALVPHVEAVAVGAEGHVEGQALAAAGRGVGDLRQLAGCQPRTDEMAALHHRVHVSRRGQRSRGRLPGAPVAPEPGLGAAIGGVLGHQRVLTDEALQGGVVPADLGQGIEAGGVQTVQHRVVEQVVDRQRRLGGWRGALGLEVDVQLVPHPPADR